MECCLTDDVVQTGGLKRKHGDDANVRPAKLHKLGKKSGFFDLGRVPPELVENIAANLHSDDPRETSRNQTNFSLANKFVHNAVAGERGIKRVDGHVKVDFDGGSPALRRFNGHLKRLGSLAGKTYHDLIPPNGLPDEASVGLPRDHRRDQPLAANDITDAAGPILPYQKADVKAKLVDSVMDLESEEAAGETLNSFARFSSGLDKEQRSDIGHDAIAILASQGPLRYYGRIKAAEALGRLEMHGHLTPNHRMELDEAVTARPELAGLLEEQKEALVAQVKRASPGTSHTSSGPTPGKMHLSYQIGSLEVQRGIAATAIFDDHDRLDVQQAIAKAIPELYNQARAELDAFVRKDHGRPDVRESLAETNGELCNHARAALQASVRNDRGR